MKNVSSILILVIATGAIALASCSGGSVSLGSVAGTDGACGASNGAIVSTAPAVGLCSVGTATTVSGTGPWTWSCVSADGGSTATCAATGAAGACGPSDGLAVLTAPTSGLCSAGTATTVSGTGPWAWSCVGVDGGATAACLATKFNASAACPYNVGAALADGCTGSPAGTPQLPHLLDVQQVTALNILTGSGYTDGTWAWSAASGSASGTVTVIGGKLGGPNGLLYTIANQGTGYLSRPTIHVPAGAGGGTGGSIVPTVYLATPHSGSTTWNMPGVDYHVGYPAGQVFKDPAIDTLPAGAKLSGKTVTITGCNVTLDGWDFTLHNIAVTVNVSSPGCTTTIQNSKQSAAAATGGTTIYPIANLSSLGAGGAFVYQYNEYDGLAAYGVAGGSGYKINDALHNSNVTQNYTVTLKYNYFHNFDAKVIQISGATSSAPNLTEKYNLFYNFANCGTACSHGEAEYTYYTGGTSASIISQFNTYYDQHLDHVTTNNTALQAIWAENMVMTFAQDDHNVVFAQGPQATCPASGNQIAYNSSKVIFDGAQGTGKLTNGTFSYNYIDAAGTYGAWFHQGSISTTTWANNFDAGTGNPCN
jgi:hypothetical protein